MLDFESINAKMLAKNEEKNLDQLAFKTNFSIVFLQKPKTLG